MVLERVKDKYKINGISISNIIISIIICIIAWYIMIHDTIIWRTSSSSSTTSTHHGVSYYKQYNSSSSSTSSSSSSTSSSSLSGGGIISNKSGNYNDKSSLKLSPPVLSRLQLYREAWNDLIYYDDNTIIETQRRSRINNNNKVNDYDDDDSQYDINDILLTVSEFSDGIGLRATKDLPSNSSLGRINRKLIISINHPIAQAYINEVDGEDIMDSMITGIICSIVYERKLDDKSIYRALWRVIGVGDLPDTLWVEQRGLFADGANNNNDIFDDDNNNLISYIANGTTMEGWYEKGNNICYNAYKWLMTTNNEDIRNVLPIIDDNEEETSIESVVYNILETTTSTTVTSSNNDDNNGAMDNTVVVLTLADVKWAYILLKGYGIWSDDGTPPMLVTPLVFARPHYRSNKMIKYNIKYKTSEVDNSEYYDEYYDNTIDDYEDIDIGSINRKEPITNKPVNNIPQSSSSSSSSSTLPSMLIEYIDLTIESPLLAGEEVFFPAYNVLSNAYAYCYRAIWLNSNNSRMPIITTISNIINKDITDILTNEGCPVIIYNNNSIINMKFWISRDDGELVIDNKLLPCYRLYSLLYYGYNNYKYYYNIYNRLPYKLELYAVNMILNNIKDNNIKRMIESSQILLNGGGGGINNNMLKDKSLLDIPLMEVREIESGLLIQFINALEDYRTIIDNVYVDYY